LTTKPEPVEGEMNANHYTYRVRFSIEDDQYLATDIGRLLSTTTPIPDGA